MVAKFTAEMSQLESARAEKDGLSPPRFDQVSDGEKHSQENAYPRDHDIGNTQEGIPSTQNSSGGEQDRFGAAVSVDWKICLMSDALQVLNLDCERPTVLNVNLICARLHGRIIIPP